MADTQQIDRKHEGGVEYWRKPENVQREIRSSIAQRDTIMSGFEDMVRAYAGPSRSKDETDFAPENHNFEWISLVLPSVLFQNPAVTIGSKKRSVALYEALALESFANRWIADTRYHRYLERVGTYWAFFCGVGLTTVEKYGEYEDPRHRPRTLVLDPKQFVMDSLARWHEEARFMGHECVESKASLLERAKNEDGWDMKALEALAVATEEGVIGRPKADVHRDDVCYWELWVPELDTREEGDSEEEYHGSILTIGLLSADGEKREPGFLRKPRPFYGPRWGPYTIFGGYTVPRSAWPLGALQAHAGQVTELNLHARTNSKSAERRKTVMLYDEADRKTAELVLNAPDGSGVGIPGFEKAHFDVFQAPGVTEAALQYEQWLRGRLVRISGINDPVLSQTATGATATADAIARDALSARMAFLEQKLYEGTRQQLMTVIWYAWHDDRIAEPLGEDFLQRLSEEGGLEPFLAEAQAQGIEITPDTKFGIKGGGFKGKFDDLELEVVPYSMRRMDEAAMQARALQMFQLLTSVAPVIPQTPWMPWRDLIDKLGEAMNWPDIGSGIDIDMANQVGMLMLQAQIQPPQQGQTGQAQRPRMGGDVGGSMPGGAPRMQRKSEMSKNGNALPGNKAGGKAGARAQKATY